MTWEPQTRASVAGKVFAILIMIVITIALAATIFIWSMSFANDMGMEQSPSLEWIEGQKAPEGPTTVHVTALMDAKFRNVAGEVRCVYTLAYTGSFIFQPHTDRSNAVIELPDSSIVDLHVYLNGVILEDPAIHSGSVVVELDANRTTNVTVSYNAMGMGRFFHTVPRGKLLDSFSMSVTVRGFDPDTLSLNRKDSLQPDLVKAVAGGTILSWNKMDALLQKDIIIDLPEWKDPYQGVVGLIIAQGIALGAILGTFMFMSRRLEVDNGLEQAIYLSAPTPLMFTSLCIGLMFMPREITLVLSLLLYLAGALAATMLFMRMRKGRYEIVAMATSLTASASLIPILGWTRGSVLTLTLLMVGVAMTLNLARRFRAPGITTAERLSIVSKELDDARKNEKELNTEVSNFHGRVKALETARKRSSIALRYCPKCGSPIKSSFTFCPICSFSLSGLKQCQACGNMLDARKKFCPSCGLRVPLPPPAIPVPEVPPTTRP